MMEDHAQAELDKIKEELKAQQPLDQPSPPTTTSPGQITPTGDAVAAGVLQFVEQNSQVEEDGSIRIAPGDVTTMVAKLRATMASPSPTTVTVDSDSDVDFSPANFRKMQADLRKAMHPTNGKRKTRFPKVKVTAGKR